MRIIARRTLREFWERHPDAEQPLDLIQVQGYSTTAAGAALLPLILLLFVLSRWAGKPRIIRARFMSRRF
jgi:hypothetical protein